MTLGAACPYSAGKALQEQRKSLRSFVSDNLLGRGLAAGGCGSQSARLRNEKALWVSRVMVPEMMYVLSGRDLGQGCRV